MTVSTSLCWSSQAAAIRRRPANLVRSISCSTGDGRLQQSVRVSMQHRGFRGADNSRMGSKSTPMSAAFLGLAAGSLCWRTGSWTCKAQGGGSPAEERSSLVAEQNYRHDRAGEAATTSVAASVSADEIAADAPASRKDTSLNLGRMDTGDHVKLIDKVRGLLFWFTTIGVAAFTYSAMLIMHPLVLAFDKHRRIAHHIGFHVWGTVSTNLFYRTEIEGVENLPPADAGAVVYVANHQSCLDIYAPYQIRRPFKYVSTTGAFRIPFVGGMMHLTDYIPVDRNSTQSQVLCLKKCMKDVREGSSVMLFPEGGRSQDGSLAAFKKGAFSVAAKEGVPVVPITIIGTGKLMPKGLDNILRCGSIKMVVHPPIRGKNATELCEQSRKVIAETLVKHGRSSCTGSNAVENTQGH